MLNGRRRKKCTVIIKGKDEVKEWFNKINKNNILMVNLNGFDDDAIEWLCSIGGHKPEKKIYNTEKSKRLFILKRKNNGIITNRVILVVDTTIMEAKVS